LTPTYALFPEIARSYTEAYLRPEEEFAFDLSRLEVPRGTTLVAIVNPNNPTGGTFDMTPLPDLLERYRDVRFLVDEAFIGVAGQSVIQLVPRYSNLLVTRTLSKVHSLAGFRIGYAVLPRNLADDLNSHNDAYRLTRTGQADGFHWLPAANLRMIALGTRACLLIDDLRSALLADIPISDIPSHFNLPPYLMRFRGCRYERELRRRLRLFSEPA
jgi:histidinol-phosphate/aromatic aminotransferase/cobyric acid decarboxylase-like protein